ncbi:MAG: hypothetical protein A2Z20_04625 [Bdellovibrionales bacterium RBG_16_40_8]|nr:MAG: hypothetical protein A2Z20_04625 [Bdellovibrionales bacterium RBG_16_40_8]
MYKGLIKRRYSMLSIIFTAFFLVLTPLWADVKCSNQLEKLEETEYPNKMSWCQKKDQRHGPFEQLSETGRPIVRAHYKENKLHGSFQRFYTSGKVESTGNYKNGRADGLWQRYYESGQLRDSGNFTDDLPTGKWSFYSESGKLTSTKNFKSPFINDKLAKVRLGIFTLNRRDKSYNEDNKTDHGLIGFDFKLKDVTSWFRLYLITDIFRADFPDNKNNYYGPHNSSKRTFILLNAGFEFIPPILPQLTLTLKTGRTLLSMSISDTEPTGGAELRYYFAKKWLNYIYFGEGDIGKNNYNVGTTSAGLAIAL